MECDLRSAGSINLDLQSAADRHGSPGCSSFTGMEVADRRSDVTPGLLQCVSHGRGVEPLEYAGLTVRRTLSLRTGG